MLLSSCCTFPVFFGWVSLGDSFFSIERDDVGFVLNSNGDICEAILANRGYDLYLALVCKSSEGVDWG